MLKIINSKKCYGNDTNPELGKNDINNIKSDEKCKLDQAFVVHLQELSLLIKFKLTLYYIEAVHYITSLFCSSLKVPYNWAFFEVDFNINIYCLLIN